EQRHSVLGGFTFEPAGPITFDLRGFYTHRVDEGDGGPLTATATIAPINPFAATLTPNPFYRSTGDANAFQAQSVSMDFSSILGAHSNQRTQLDTWGVTPTVTADLGHGWQLRLLGNYGRG